MLTLPERRFRGRRGSVPFNANDLFHKENSMQTRCWRLTGILTLLWMLTLAGPPAHAARLQSGIHGMAWGDHASDYPHLEKIREQGGASYYINRQMAYRTAGQAVTGVVYGFYRDRLFAAYIKLNTPNQAFYLEKHFSGEYGPAKVKAAGAETVYRWAHGDLKIKLKVNDASEDIKLGIYYQPLSSKLNQTLAEEGPSDAFTDPSSGDNPPQSAPLF
jgi:hypothetical protein